MPHAFLNSRVLDVGRLAKLVSFCLGLHSKFSRWGKNQQSWAIPGVVAQVLQVQHAWQQEAAGLPAPSLGNGDQVTTTEGDWPSLSLNGCGGFEAGTADLWYMRSWEQNSKNSLGLPLRIVDQQQVKPVEGTS